ncbi:MAG: dihydroorotase [Rectinema sp.]
MFQIQDRFTMRMPDDFHAHLRQGGQLPAYVRGHAGQFGRVLLMPNTLPPVSDLARQEAYRAEVGGALDTLPENERFEPLFTFKILPGMRGAEVEALARAGVVAGKYYPAGATTNAANGPRSFDEVEDALSAMEAQNLVLCIHGEAPEVPVLERERAFLPQVEHLLVRHPRLRVVLEHLSDARSVRFVETGPDNLAATITAQHLLFTIDDMIGDSMHPHLYCKPVLKFARDRDALRAAVLSGSKKFFFGSDSAPHPREKKECGAAASGVYSSPSALPALVGLFDSLGSLDSLIPFMTERGAAFYGLPLNSRMITLERGPWEVPKLLGGAVPMCAGQTLEWRVTRN